MPSLEFRVGASSFRGATLFIPNDTRIAKNRGRQPLAIHLRGGIGCGGVLARIRSAASSAQTQLPLPRSIASNLLGRIRSGEEMRVSALGLSRLCVGSMGTTPTDASKVSMPEGDGRDGILD